MSAARRTILIAGGGIAGLTAALCLAREGWRIDLFERAEGFETVGAGLQISPNAFRIIAELGLDQQLKLVATGPGGIRVRSGRTGAELATVPLGETALNRYGAPYLVVHRADLQQVLAAAANDHPDIRLHMGCALEDGALHPNGVTALAYMKGRMQEFAGSAIVAADGVWSDIRKRMLDAPAPKFSGLVAWRGLVSAAALPGSQDFENVQLFLAPNAHAVAYPVRGGRYLNLVAITRHPRKDGEPSRGWAHEANPGELARMLDGWCDEVQNLVAHRTRWTKWPLFEAPQLDSWSFGNLALIGDAAHAMLPFAAQGAAMAIEDAAVLARSMRPALAGDASVEACLADYSKRRMGRVERARRLAIANQRIYHLPDVLTPFRDFGMWTFGGVRLLARQDWLYGWRADEA